MTQKNILCLLQNPPYLGNRLFETFDTLLVAAAFEQQVSLLFRGAAVTGLLKDQSPRQQRSLSKMLGSLAAYEISQIYADASAFEQHHLRIADCAIEPVLLRGTQIGELINRHSVVLTD